MQKNKNFKSISVGYFCRTKFYSKQEMKTESFFVNNPLSPIYIYVKNMQESVRNITTFESDRLR